MRWLSIVALLLASCGPKHEPVPTASESRGPVLAPTSNPAPAAVLPVAPDAALAKRLDAVIDKAIADQTIVGTVVMIARDGKVVYARAAGLADREAKRAMREDTLFRLASMTKPITVLTALALIDQGKLALADPVTKWLPDFKPKLADGRAPTITVRHLITHTS